MATEIKEGRVYLGPFNARMLILSIEGDIVKVMFCSSLREATFEIREVESWADESDVRIYYPSDYNESRTKIFEGTRSEYGAVPDVNDPNALNFDPNEQIVVYRETVSGNIVTVTKDEWDAWRQTVI